MQRRQIFYEGHVQGVGFRYTTRSISAEFAVTGFVRNLSDGRVEVVVEGEAGELDALQAEIARRMEGYIRKQTVDQRPATGEFSRFEVRF